MHQGIDMGIAGKTAVVCGSSAGLGKACAIALARAGVQVTVNGRNEAKLTAAAAEIERAADMKVTVAAADVTTAEGRAALLAVTPSPDILVNNAAGPPPGDFRTWTEAAWLKVINDNMLSAIHLTTAVMDGMIARRWGRVINITSGAVKMVIPMLGLSTAARAGLTGFTAALAREVAGHGVTVNNLLPGLFETQRMEQYFDRTAASRNVAKDTIKAERVAEIPVGHAGNPEDFGVWCAFIASRHSGYLTGQNILIDGGAFNGVI
jgi:3-oxoacyl-[acyl-carrier protein] reductase